MTQYVNFSSWWVFTGTFDLLIRHFKNERLFIKSYRQDGENVGGGGGTDAAPEDQTAASEGQVVDTERMEQLQAQLDNCREELRSVIIWILFFQVVWF